MEPNKNAGFWELCFGRNSFLETGISVATYKASYKQKCKFNSISLRGYSPVRIILCGVRIANTSEWTLWISADTSEWSLWISADTSGWSLWISADTSEWSLNICRHIWMVFEYLPTHLNGLSEYLMTHLNGVYEYIFHHSVLLYWQWVTEASEGWTLIQSCVINKCDCFHFLYALFLYINVTDSARDNNIKAKTHKD